MASQIAKNSLKNFLGVFFKIRKYDTKTKQMVCEQYAALQLSRQYSQCMRKFPLMIHQEITPSMHQLRKQKNKKLFCETKNCFAKQKTVSRTAAKQRYILFVFHSRFLLFHKYSVAALKGFLPIVLLRHYFSWETIIGKYMNNHFVIS